MRRVIHCGEVVVASDSAEYWLRGRSGTASARHATGGRNRCVFPIFCTRRTDRYIRPPNLKVGRKVGSGGEPLPRESQRLAVRRTGVTECRRHDDSSLLRLDLGDPDHLAPFLGFAGNQLAEVGRRAWKCGDTQHRKPRLHLGMSEGRVDLPI
jgi:hypothetical protein